MGPAAPVPLTRAAARASALGRVETTGDRAHSLHRFALSGGAVAGAALVLVIAGLAGVPHPGSAPARSTAELIAVPTPTPTAVSPSPRATPRPTSSPSDQAADPPVPTPPETLETAETAAAGSPESEAPPTTAAPEPAAPAEPAAPGKSGEAPGRNKPPTKP